MYCRVTDSIGMRVPTFKVASALLRTTTEGEVRNSDASSHLGQVLDITHYWRMFPLAYVPPLWFKVMDPRVVKATGCDASRVNFLPAQRKRLVQAFGMKDEVGVAA